MWAFISNQGGRIFILFGMSPISVWSYLHKTPGTETLQWTVYQQNKEQMVKSGNSICYGHASKLSQIFRITSIEHLYS